MDFDFLSNFLMICDCKSYTHIFDINYIINLRVYNEQKMNIFKKYQTKPIDYTICLYDIYLREYWIYDEKTQDKIQDKENLIAEVNNYIIDNNNKFKKCFVEMRLYLLQKLNNYDINLFLTSFIEYFHLLTYDKIYISKYYDDFIELLTLIKNNSKNTSIGVYIIENNVDILDKMLYNYCTTHFKNNDVTDANYIIQSINHLCK